MAVVMKAPDSTSDGIPDAKVVGRRGLLSLLSPLRGWLVTLARFVPIRALALRAIGGFDVGVSGGPFVITPFTAPVVDDLFDSSHAISILQVIYGVK